MSSHPISRRVFVAALAGASVATASAATDYPSRAIRIVVPVPPGAANDTLARILATRLAAAWKATVIVDNRAGGAGGSVGAEYVANAEPDGYTLLFAGLGPTVFNKLLYAKLGYDPAQFVPIANFASGNFVLITRQDAPFKTAREFVDYAKARPGALNYGSGGSGTTTHLAMEMVKARAGIDLTHVPYKGSAAANNALMQGQIDVSFVELAAMVPHIRSGRLRPLAVGARQRVASLPNVPPLADTLPDFFVNVSFGLVAPAHTPAEIVAKLSSTITAIQKTSELVTLLRGMEMQPIAGTPQEYRQFMHDEGERWGSLIRSAKIRAE
jgi:tripartite-type tricarboxylate transporter receptor subunit TctC